MNSPPQSSERSSSPLSLFMSGKTRDNDFLHGLGAELAFIQDISGCYVSFYWRESQRYKLPASRVVDTSLEEVFGPVAVDAYRERVQQVVDCLVPQRLSCKFHLAEALDDGSFAFDLVISPILTALGVSRVLVMGRSIVSEPDDEIGEYDEFETEEISPEEIPANFALLPSSARYQRLLAQIARNIRRTLDLETIWQQTVHGLGNALEVSRCLICPYNNSSNEETLKVAAEYCRDSITPMLDSEIQISGEPYLAQALKFLEPVAVEHLSAEDAFQRKSMMVVATCYQDQPNGFIFLHQCDRARQWTAAEIELVRELADQVGTAIAHATLFSESQSLAVELQRLNSDLMDKHEELEVAREEAEAASRLKSEFLANTSHELRTPLNGIIGFLKLIIDGMADDPEEQINFIREAHDSALHLLDIINDILDVAKIEAGKMNLDLGPVKLQELFGDVSGFTIPQAKQKSLNFQVQQPATYDEIVVYGNYQRLLQVMLNLVGNAIKFTHEGGVTISSRVVRRKEEFQGQEFPGFVEVRVVDTGIGVSLEKQDKLFQSFSQVDGSRTRQYGGTGLGLVISQKLVEAMGGDVYFFSMGEGLGSTVTFTVPLYEDPVIISSEQGSD